MNKCPRCKLPQEETDRCQYCGYVLSKNKKHLKTIRNKLNDIIDALIKDQIFATKKSKLMDRGGTRSGTDRRKRFSINYFPEKRSGKDRRKMINIKGQAARRKL
jgi:hypothetical protein